MKKLIAIVAGGDSSEYGVSLRSAEGIYSFMDTERYEVYIVEMRGTEWKVNYGLDKLPIDKSDFSFVANGERRRFDFAYITIHGTPGENGVLQGYFDLIGIPYSTSGVLVEALTFNKFALNNFLRSFPELHVSESVVVRKNKVRPSDEEILQRVGLPCFVKPNAGGSSFGVTKVKTADALTDAIDKAMMESDEVMIEKLLVGREITCGCYHGMEGVHAFPITEVVTTQEFFDYDAKYNGKVEEITPARISPQTAHRVSELTKHIYELLDCYGIIRIDYILSGEEGAEQINILEINTTPGMTATSFIPQQVAADGRVMKDILAEVIEGKF